MSAANAHIGHWLGIQPPATDSDTLRIVEGRLATPIINRLTALGLERSEIIEAIISSRTLQHRRSRREKLTIEESDRVLRMIRALSAVETIYGSRERALAWMWKPQAQLEGRMPLSLLKTDTGCRVVALLPVPLSPTMRKCIASRSRGTRTQRLRDL
jgi:putative toxin-antitoxin system antitoxin component (TIGR02293 family)